jgi:hypothetical protein
MASHAAVPVGQEEDAAEQAQRVAKRMEEFDKLGRRFDSYSRNRQSPLFKLVRSGRRSHRGSRAGGVNVRSQMATGTFMCDFSRLDVNCRAVLGARMHTCTRECDTCWPARAERNLSARSALHARSGAHLQIDDAVRHVALCVSHPLAVPTTLGSSCPLPAQLSSWRTTRRRRTCKHDSAGASAAQRPSPSLHPHPLTRVQPGTISTAPGALKRAHKCETLELFSIRLAAPVFAEMGRSMMHMQSLTRVHMIGDRGTAAALSFATYLQRARVDRLPAGRQRLGRCAQRPRIRPVACVTRRPTAMAHAFCVLPLTELQLRRCGLTGASGVHIQQIIQKHAQRRWTRWLCQSAWLTSRTETRRPGLARCAARPAT